MTPDTERTIQAQVCLLKNPVSTEKNKNKKTKVLFPVVLNEKIWSKRKAPNSKTGKKEGGRTRNSCKY